jgi:hypothetical protein
METIESFFKPRDQYFSTYSLKSGLLVALLIGALGLAQPRRAAEFTCASGNVACLIDAINQANANGEANRITLRRGIYTFTAVDNDTDGPNALPSVTSQLTIQGAGADLTVLVGGRGSRLGHVAATGTLTLTRLTVQGFGFRALFNRGTLLLTATTFTGNFDFPGGGLDNEGGTVTITRSLFTQNGGGLTNGGGIFSAGGTVLITRTRIINNVAGDGQGGGVYNARGGLMILDHTTVGGNNARYEGGGVLNGGTMIILNSTVADNKANDLSAGGGGLENFGTMTIRDSTIARNTTFGAFSPFGVTGGGIANVGSLTLVNATVADNVAQFNAGGGISGSAVLVNTLLARNQAPDGSDCDGSITSLGNNLIGDPSSCTITLQPTDLTGNPGLGALTDNGRPGNGHFPLLRGSPAIDAGNAAFCSPTDQLGRRRVGPCDIGAIRFPEGREDEP